MRWLLLAALALGCAAGERAGDGDGSPQSGDAGSGERWITCGAGNNIEVHLAADGAVSASIPGATTVPVQNWPAGTTWIQFRLSASSSDFVYIDLAAMSWADVGATGGGLDGYCTSGRPG